MIQIHSFDMNKQPSILHSLRAIIGKRYSIIFNKIHSFLFLLSTASISKQFEFVYVNYHRIYNRLLFCRFFWYENFCVRVSMCVQVYFHILCFSSSAVHILLITDLHDRYLFITMRFIFIYQFTLKKCFYFALLS